MATECSHVLRFFLCTGGGCKMCNVSSRSIWRRKEARWQLSSREVAPQNRHLCFGVFQKQLCQQHFNHISQHSIMLARYKCTSLVLEKANEYAWKLSEILYNSRCYFVENKTLFQGNRLWHQREHSQSVRPISYEVPFCSNFSGVWTVLNILDVWSYARRVSGEIQSQVMWWRQKEPKQSLMSDTIS